MLRHSYRYCFTNAQARGDDSRWGGIATFLVDGGGGAGGEVELLSCCEGEKGEESEEGLHCVWKVESGCYDKTQESTGGNSG